MLFLEMDGLNEEIYITFVRLIISGSTQHCEGRASVTYGETEA